MGKRNDQEPLPDDEVFLTGARWVEASFMQAQRFEDIAMEWGEAVAAATTRRLIADTGEDAWAQGHPPVKVPSLVLNWQAQSEMDLLVVALNNVMRAVSRVHGEDRVKMTDAKIITLLRNSREHFDATGWSARELVTKSISPASELVAYTSKEISVAEVPLSRIRAWLGRVDAVLREQLSTKGHELPDDEASLAEGDDELPGERLRYRYWDIPLVDEEHWQREELPPGLHDLLAQRFQHLRERDGVD